MALLKLRMTWKGDLSTEATVDLEGRGFDDRSYVCMTWTGATSAEVMSPTLLNIFLERIMTDALEDQEGTVSI